MVLLLSGPLPVPFAQGMRLVMLGGNPESKSGCEFDVGAGDVDVDEWA